MAAATPRESMMSPTTRNVALTRGRMAGSRGGRRATPQEVMQTAARRVPALIEREPLIEVRLAVHFSEGEASVFDRGRENTGTVPVSRFPVSARAAGSVS